MEHLSKNCYGGLPPRVIWQVATERRADRGAELPVQGSQQIVIQDVSIDAHVVHELGRVGTLFGEHHFSGKSCWECCWDGVGVLGVGLCGVCSVCVVCVGWLEVWWLDVLG